jgi:uncharacterized membrane protein YhhN
MIFGFALMGISAVFVGIFLRAFYKRAFNEALIFKGLASLCFVILGAAIYLAGAQSLPELLVLIGLCCGIVGDEIIALCQVLPKHDKRAFLSGGVCFIVGHICYVVALFMRGTISWIGLALTAVLLAALTVIYARKTKYFIPEMRRSTSLYFFIVIAFASVSAGAFFGGFEPFALLFAMGGLLFAMSDNILFAYKLGKNPKFSQNIILHVAYYLAQFSIAWSIAFI